MRVSIIIAAYNAEDFIVDTIKSVQAQTFNDWELIVVDDGSKDNTSLLVSKLATEDSRIKLVQQQNSGAQVARNVAFSVTQGEYIVILDADDRILPNKLAMQAELLDKMPDYGVGYGDTWHCNHKMERQVLESKKYPNQHMSGDVFDRIILGNLFAVHSAMVRRICISDVGLHDLNPELIADWDFWVRIAEKYPFYYHSDAIAEYRFHSGMSAKTDVAIKQLKQRLGVARKIERMERFSKLNSKKQGDFYFANGRFAQRFGLKREALDLYKKSLSAFPFNPKVIICSVVTIIGLFL